MENPNGGVARPLPFAWLKPLAAKLSAVRTPRRLKLIESLPLGEKRFLALVEVGGQRLLVGSTPTNISLIERLPATSLSEQAASPEQAAHADETSAHGSRLPRAC